jgi:serine phosphatase RsbU (regulator of sigma subunit)
VSWGEKNLGLMRIHGMGSSQFQEEESHFAQTLASSLATALANIEFVAKTEEKARMDKELETARAVQEALLPPSANFPGLDFASSYFSAAQTGGDWLGYYYDKQSHRLDFYVGDVTGHGIGPSLLTGVICGGIYSCEETLSLTASTQQQSFSLEARLSILAQVLNRIVAQTGKSHHLATMAFLSLDLSTGKGAFLNAGHNNPFIISNSTGEAHSIPNAGSRLGYTSKPQFSVRSFEVSENDIVFVYTDGLIENSGPTGKLLKPKRLKEILTTSKDVSVIQETLTTECRNLWETNLQDDVTTLFIKWKGPIDRTAITAENISIPGCSALEWNPTNS